MALIQDNLLQVPAKTNKAKMKTVSLWISKHFIH